MEWFGPLRWSTSSLHNPLWHVLGQFRFISWITESLQCLKWHPLFSKSGKGLWNFTFCWSSVTSAALHLLNALLHKHTLHGPEHTRGGDGTCESSVNGPGELSSLWRTLPAGSSAAGWGMLCHATKAGWCPGRRRLELACEQLSSAARDGEQVVLSCCLEKQLDLDVIHHESRPSFCLYVLMDVVFSEMHHHVL